MRRDFCNANINEAAAYAVKIRLARRMLGQHTSINENITNDVPALAIRYSYRHVAPINHQKRLAAPSYQ